MLSDSERDRYDLDRSSNRGVVTSVRGSVVDVRLDGPLPAIHSVLHAGAGDAIVIEVLTQRALLHVRGVALTSTEGLSRGMVVTDTGAPLQAPVGKAVVSRMFDVFGQAIDGGEPLTDVAGRSVGDVTLGHDVAKSEAQRRAGWQAGADFVEEAARQSQCLCHPIPFIAPAGIRQH